MTSSDGQNHKVLRQQIGHGSKLIMFCRYLGSKVHNRIMQNCVTRWNSAKLLGMSGSPIGKQKGNIDRLIKLMEFPEAADQLLPWGDVLAR